MKATVEIRALSGTAFQDRYLQSVVKITTSKCWEYGSRLGLDMRDTCFFRRVLLDLDERA